VALSAYGSRPAREKYAIRQKSLVFWCGLPKAIRLSQSAIARRVRDMLYAKKFGFLA
jgi:hypothetical protein